MLDEEDLDLIGEIGGDEEEKQQVRSAPHNALHRLAI